MNRASTKGDETGSPGRHHTAGNECRDAVHRVSIPRGTSIPHRGLTLIARPESKAAKRQPDGHRPRLRTPRCGKRADAMRNTGLYSAASTLTNSARGSAGIRQNLSHISTNTYKKASKKANIIFLFFIVLTARILNLQQRPARQFPFVFIMEYCEICSVEVIVKSSDKHNYQWKA